MSVERKEPTLSGFSAAQEESVTAEVERSAPKSESSVKEPQSKDRSATPSAGPVREGRAAEPKSAASPTRQRPRPAPVSEAQPKSGGSGLAAFALVLALGGLGLAGYAQWQLMQTQQQLLAADQRIVGLEQKLTLTDDEATQSVTALQANLKEARDSLELAHAEIRKLWDTRNVNRKGIADNEAALADVKKSASGAASTAAEAKKLAQAQEGNWKALRSDVSLQTEQLSMITDQSDGQQKRLRELVDKANQLDSQMKQLQGDLAKRVKSNEEAIQAIDAYRRSVNRDILDIKRQLNPNS